MPCWYGRLWTGSGEQLGWGGVGWSDGIGRVLSCRGVSCRVVLFRVRVDGDCFGYWAEITKGVQKAEWKGRQTGGGGVSVRVWLLLLLVLSRQGRLVMTTHDTGEDH